MNTNFITAEEFLKQSEKVQEVLIKWWKPTLGDIFTTKRVYDEIDVVIRSEKVHIYGLNETFEGNCFSFVDETLEPFPLLQMHQLVDFIEDKTGKKINVTETDYMYHIKATTGTKNYDGISDGLLNALWQVTIKIVG